MTTPLSSLQFSKTEDFHSNDYLKKEYEKIIEEKINESIQSGENWITLSYTNWPKNPEGHILELLIISSLEKTLSKPEYQKIKEIDFVYGDFKEETRIQLFSLLPKLTSINSLAIGDFDAEKLCHLINIDKSFLDRLEKLSLPRSGGSSNYAQDLKELFSKTPSLEVLNLSLSTIEDDEFTLILETLKKCPLKELDLSENLLSEKSIYNLSKSKIKTIEEINLNKNCIENLTHAHELIKYTSIKKLRIAENSISERSLDLFLSILGKSETIENPREIFVQILPQTDTDYIFPNNKFSSLMNNPKRHSITTNFLIPSRGLFHFSLFDKVILYFLTYISKVARKEPTIKLSFINCTNNKKGVIEYKKLPIEEKQKKHQPVLENLDIDYQKFESLSESDEDVEKLIIWKSVCDKLKKEENLLVLKFSGCEVEKDHFQHLLEELPHFNSTIILLELSYNIRTLNNDFVKILKKSIGKVSMLNFTGNGLNEQQLTYLLDGERNDDPPSSCTKSKGKKVEETYVPLEKIALGHNSFSNFSFLDAIPDRHPLTIDLFDYYTDDFLEKEISRLKETPFLKRKHPLTVILALEAPPALVKEWEKRNIHIEIAI